MKHITRLENEPIPKLLLQFSLPSVIGMLVNALYNVVDRIYVGQGVGTTAISALTVIFPVFLIIFGMIMLVGAGGGALISLYLGEKKKDRAQAVITTGIIMMFIVSLLAVVPGLIFTKQILLIAGISPEALPLGTRYLKIIFCFTPFQFLAWGLNSFIRSSGNPMRSMYSMIAGAVINIILDPIFIFGFKMGISGAAVATGISYIVTAVWNVWHFVKVEKTFSISLFELQFDKEIFQRIIKIGMPLFIMQVVNSAFNFVLNHQILAYGGEMKTVAQATIGIIYGFNMLFFMPLLGINMGIQPIIGYNYGAKLFGRVKYALKSAILVAVSLTTLCFILCQLFPVQIFTAFNRSDLQLIEFGSGMMRITMIAFPLIGFMVVGSGYFQAVGRHREATFLSIFRPLMVMIPLLFILPYFIGLKGVFIALPLTDSITALVVAALMIIEHKRLFPKKDLEAGSSIAEAAK